MALESTPNDLWCTFYKEKCFIKSINPNVTVCIQDFYVNLEGVEISEPNSEDKKSEDDEGRLSSNFTTRDDQILGRRITQKPCIPITSRDVLADGKKKVLIYGSPGTGKTTICKKIVYDFYVEKIWLDRFDEIIWIPLRNLKWEPCLKILDNEKNQDLKTVQKDIVKRLFEEAEMSDDFWTRILNNEKILYILDGWDEIHDCMENSTNPSMQNIVNTFYKKENVILTTRPFAYVKLKDFEQAFEIRGFNSENIKRYTRLVLKETQLLGLYAKIVEYIDTTIVNDLATIPILLDIFLFCWDDAQFSNNETLTMTQLYEKLFKRLWLLFLERIGDNKAKDSSLFNLMKNGKIGTINGKLCGLGMKWLQDGILEFFIHDFDLKMNEQEDINNVTFVSQITTGNQNKDRVKLEFVHLTICEFFAALDIVRQTEEKDDFLLEDFVASHKYNPRLSVVFQFTAGLFHMKDEVQQGPKCFLSRFFNALEAEPIDLFGNYHYPFLTNCLAECVLESERVKEITCELMQYVSNYFFRLDTFSKLPISLVEMIITSKDKSLHRKLLDFKMKLPSFPTGFIEKLKLLKLDNLHRLNEISKLKLLCKQIAHCNESKEYVYQLLKSGENSYMKGSASEVLKFLTLLPSGMRKYIIKNVFQEPHSKVALLGTLTSADLNWSEIVQFCQLFVQAIDTKDNINAVINKLMDSSIKTKIDVMNLIFLKNIEDVNLEISKIIIERFDKAIIDEKLTSLTSVKKLHYWIEVFGINNDQIRKQLVQLSDIDNNSKDNKFSSICTILDLYKGKDIPKQESKCIINFFRISKADTDVMRLLFQKISQCGSLTSYEEKIIKNHVISQFKERNFSVTYPFLDKRKFSEEQLDTILKHYGIITNVRFILNHLGSQSVKTFICERMRDPNLQSEILNLLREKQTSEWENYPEDVKDKLFFNTEDHLNSLKESIGSALSGKWKESEKICRDYVEKPDKPERPSQPEIEKMFVKAICGNGLSDAQKRIVMLDTRLPAQISLKMFQELFKQRGVEFQTAIKLLCEEIHNENHGYYIYNILFRSNVETEINPAHLIKYVTSENYKQLFHLIASKLHPWVGFMEVGPVPNKHAVFVYDKKLHYGVMKNDNEEKLAESDVSYMKNCITASNVDRCCRNIRLNVAKDFTKFTFKTKLENLENMEEIIKIMKNVKEDSGKVIYEDSPNNKIPRIARFNTALQVLHPKTSLRLTKFMKCVNFTENTPLKNILEHLSHLDLSGTKISDNEITSTLCTYIKNNTVHTLILSDNKITQSVFSTLVTRVCRCRVKHLFVDRNFVYLNDAHMEYFLEKIKSSMTNGNGLETLDISGNFLSPSIIQKLLANSNSNENMENNFAYSMIRGCKIIYCRKVENGFLAVFDSLNGPSNSSQRQRTRKEEEKVFIDEKTGCVAVAKMNTMHGYSGHHIIIIERMQMGQRVVQTAELLHVGGGDCKIELEHVDPFHTLKSRMEEKYSVERTKFPNDKIHQLLTVIEESQSQQDFLRYNLDSDSGGMNCVTWIKDMMDDLAKHSPATVNAPPYFLMKLVSFFTWLFCLFRRN